MEELKLLKKIGVSIKELQSQNNKYRVAHIRNMRELLYSCGELDFYPDEILADCSLFTSHPDHVLNIIFDRIRYSFPDFDKKVLAILADKKPMTIKEYEESSVRGTEGYSEQSATQYCDCKYPTLGSNTWSCGCGKWFKKQ